MRSSRKMTLTITLKSDLCGASGDGFAGVVDTDVAYNTAGLPYIPSKRVKGCLREAALEILEIEPEREEAFVALFGLPGQSASGGLTISNGMLANHAALAAEAVQEKFSSDAVLSCYTSIRTRTRIENGHAADKSLRSARVVNSGNVFIFDVECPDDSVIMSLLIRSCKLLRHMGLNRSRGLGEVSCALADADEEDSAIVYQITDFGNKKQISYTITLSEHIISGDRYGKPFATEGYIMGSAVQGWLAGKWLAANGNPADVYKDVTFRKLFLSGDVTFSSAFPALGDRVFYPTPITVKTDKEKKQVVDESAIELVMTEPPCSRRLGGFAATDSGNVVSFNVSKDVFSHHARPTDKRIGHATADAGQFYNYEAISDGYTFSGRVIGGEAEIKIIKQLLEDNPFAKLGRSTTAQYGKACVAPRTPQYLQTLTVPANGKVRLVARTPIVLRDSEGTVTPNPSLIPALLGFPALSIVKTFAAETVASGYNATWRLPRPQLRAIAEGSAIVLENTGSASISLRSTIFIGMRTDCGFGEVSLEQLPQGALTLNKVEFIPAADAEPGTELANIINVRRRKEQDVREGSDYAQKTAGLAPQNSQLSRLTSFLANATNYSDLAAKLLDIKQPKQQKKMLAFCTGKREDWFDTQNLTTVIVEREIKKFTGDKTYTAFKGYIISAVRQIKQIRRATDRKRAAV